MTSSPPPSAPRNNPMRGALYLIGGIFAFSLHDTAVKWVSGYALTELLFVRTATALPLLTVFVWLDVGLRALKAERMGLVLVRAFLLFLGYLAFYMGLAVLTLADTVAIYMSAPLIILALAGPFLGERVGLLRVLAVIVGFVGVIIMLRPGEGVFEPGGLFVLACAILYSFGMIIGRRLGVSTPASVMAFIANATFLSGAIVLGLLFSALELPGLGHPSLDFLVKSWTWPTGRDLLLMVSCGFTSAVGIAGLTFAYREAEANSIASFEYTALVWALMWGYLLFGDVPTATSMTGAALIVGAGLVALYAGRGN